MPIDTRAVAESVRDFVQSKPTKVLIEELKAADIDDPVVAYRLALEQFILWLGSGSHDRSPGPNSLK